MLVCISLGFGQVFKDTKRHVKLPKVFVLSKPSTVVRGIGRRAENHFTSCSWSSLYKVIAGSLSLVISTPASSPRSPASVCDQRSCLYVSVCHPLSLLSIRRYLTVSLILVLQFRTRRLTPRHTPALSSSMALIRSVLRSSDPGALLLLIMICLIDLPHFHDIARHVDLSILCADALHEVADGGSLTLLSACRTNFLSPSP